MSDKRIIELDVTDVVEADDFLAIDSVSGTTRRIKPIKIGATYEIEDGDHEFTLIGSNGYEHTVHLPVDAVSMTQAEYDALTPEQKADGTTRFITDGQSDVESELWSKVGRQTLDTDAQVLSNAVNELVNKTDTEQTQIDENIENITTNTNAISQLESSLENLKVRFVNLFNAQTPFNIDIGFEPTGSRTAQILMYNANRGCAYIIKYETELGVTKIITTSPDLTLSRSGSVLTITTSSRLWGVTTLIITEGNM